ncbi:HEPN domain-containing protein [Mesorhizobium xinjiangense]|uniref:HEPN domain-containing protein n=1 Tax=Mesorhizobium xinjiangense TaxID=2678685 RepID=UPI0012EDF432|nr:HEPN domain-containing protein [Mesorhizobium xinjiangense]
MSKKKKYFDSGQKKQLLEHARDVITGFNKGVVMDDDPNPHDWGEYGVTLFAGYSARFTEDYLKARREFTGLAAKMLKAKSAHEKTIRTLCQKAGQEYVKLTAAIDQPIPNALNDAAKALVDTVLAEAGREYVHIEPNFLVRHEVSDVVALGRVRSMRTELAVTNTPLSKTSRVMLTVGAYPKQSFHEGGTTSLCMPSSVWVIDVPATKENVAEEAKWLIDVAVSLMRLSARKWQGHFPKMGDLEAHPTYPTIHTQPHVTMEGDTLFTGGGKLPGWYETNAEVAAELGTPEVQSKAAVLFDPTDKSLAYRVAHGLGWMTRGRQVSDRSERLLSFFTALEALLTSNDKNDPVTQTISRHVAVIYTQDVKTRVAVYNQIKGLYSLRSTVVHSGRREVLWQDVINLQVYVETIFWVVLNRCDLSMSQDRFMQSLADASHGLQWEFAAPEKIEKSGVSEKDGEGE